MIYFVTARDISPGTMNSGAITRGGREIRPVPRLSQSFNAIEAQMGKLRAVA